MTRLAALVLVVRDLEHALAVYEQSLGLSRLEPVCEVPGLGARRAVLQAAGCTIELLEPHDESKPPGMFLRQRGEGVFALTVGVDDPGRTRERLERAGIDFVLPADAAAGHPTTRCFLRPRDGHGVVLEVGPVDPPDPPGE